MIVITNMDGQLCNRIILFAHVYGTGIETNQKVYHYFWKETSEYFKLIKDENIDFCKIHLPYAAYHHFFHRHKRLKLNKNQQVAEQLLKCEEMKKNPEKKYIIDSWYYRDYQSLFKHHDKITEFFRPREDINNEIEEWCKSNIYNVDAVTVGIHMRRGDYITWENGKYYFTDEEYLRYMKMLCENTGKKIRFVLVSNEFVEINHFDEVDAIKGPAKKINDLYILAKCDYIMGPPSSYSWWAAYYGWKKYLTLYSKDSKITLDDFKCVEGEEFNTDTERV